MAYRTFILSGFYLSGSTEVFASDSRGHLCSCIHHCSITAISNLAEHLYTLLEGCKFLQILICILKLTLHPITCVLIYIQSICFFCDDAFISKEFYIFQIFLSCRHNLKFNMHFMNYLLKQLHKNYVNTKQKTSISRICF